MSYQMNKYLDINRCFLEYNVLIYEILFTELYYILSDTANITLN